MLIQFLNKMAFPEDIFPDNQEVLNAFNLAEFTSRPLYITGKAGTGKSTFLRHYCQNTHKQFLILAPTGIAALNVGGQTIHSFFGLPWRPLQPNDREIPYFPKETKNDDGTVDEPEHPKRSIIRNLDVIIIDEISMVRPDMIDAIDNSLRKNGGNAGLPFGGKQIIFIGDLFQLEPVVTKEDKPILSRFYESPFFFSASVFKQLQFSNIELLKVYRQSDPNFIGLLNKIRKREANVTDFSTINQRLNQNYVLDPSQYFIILCTRNDIAKNTNAECLQKITSPEFTYEGVVTDKFNDGDLPTEKFLKLKVGAQVMFVKNDSESKWVNGTIGKVTKLTDYSIKVKVKKGDTETEYEVEQAKWEKTEYKWNEEKKEIESEVVGTFVQYPLKLAWAITIHKSQGLTFDQVVIDSGTGMFAHGQLYVALSRCTSFEGLVFRRPVQQNDMIVDERVVEIANNANNQNAIDSQLLAGLLESVRRMTYRQQALINENKQLSTILKNRENTITEIEKTNKQLREIINKNKAQCDSLTNKLNNSNKEIERLNKITWWQKLFGKK